MIGVARRQRFGLNWDSWDRWDNKGVPVEVIVYRWLKGKWDGGTPKSGYSDRGEGQS